jgi:hypothetical protein
MDYFGCKNLFQRRSCGETSADLSTKAQEQRKIKGLLTNRSADEELNHENESENET